MEPVNSAPMVISRGGYAALMRVLLEHDDLQITAIENEAVDVGHPSANRFYRVRLTAEGEAGTFRMTVLLKVLPDVTWMEVWNPQLDGPAELMLLESDLLSSLPSGLVDPTIASARAREDKPAWTMTSDLVAELGEAGLDKDGLRLALVRLSELHTLHWAALPVLDYVYPWLTRQAEWLHQAAAFYAAVLDEVVPDDPAGHLLLDEQPQAVATVASLFEALEPADRATLTGLLADPTWLVERLLAAPLTVVHGAAHIDHIALIDGNVVMVEWERMQVAPSSWDVWTLLSSLRQSPLSETEAVGFYLDALEAGVGLIDRAAWQDTYRLAPITAFLLRDLPQAVRGDPGALPNGWLDRAAEVAALVRIAQEHG